MGSEMCIRDRLNTNNGGMTLKLAELLEQDEVHDAGGLEKQLRVFRLPDDNAHYQIEDTVEIPLHNKGDNPLWMCVTTEDGFQGWSSPVFVFS